MTIKSNDAAGIRIPGDTILEPLGHIQLARFYYRVCQWNSVIDLLPSEHNENRFLAIATEAEWKATYPQHMRKNQQTKGKYFHYTSLGEELMAGCRRAGTFDPGQVRGRGCYMDKGRVVYNWGDALFVNGVEQSFDEFDADTSYVYTSGAPITRPASEVVGPEIAGPLHDLFVTWTYGRGGADQCLIVGAIAVAPICGALKWRPHVWITGSKGTGKSTLLIKIKEVLGSVALDVQGGTTEAGLRQELRYEARPCLFDEFEGDSKSAGNIIALARTAASENDAKLIKGQPSGTPIAYTVQFSGIFAGINTNLETEADRSRFVEIELMPLNHSIEFGRREMEMATEALGSEIGPRLVARMLQQLANGSFDIALEVFRDGLRRFGGDERYVDLYGHLLAGSWVLEHDQPPEAKVAYEVAIVLAGDHDRNGVSDERECLDRLLQHAVRVELGPPMTVGELLQYFKDGISGRFELQAVERDLAATGVRLDRQSGEVWIANRLGIEAVYAGSRWAGAHVNAIRRLGGLASSSGRRFGGASSRYTRLPWETVFPDDSATD